MRPQKTSDVGRNVVESTADALGSQLSRRSLLKRAGILGVSAPVVASLLAACEAEDDDATDADTDDNEAEPEPGEDEEATEEVDEDEPVDEADESEDETEEEPGGDRYGGTLRFALHRDPIGLEPNIGYGATTSSLQWNVYDSLLTYDTEGEIVPSLAESWETPDELTFIFHLRDDVTFHNGNQFTAEDVIFTFERMLDEELGATRRPEIERMESFEAVDDYTVEVKLEEPFATLLAALATDVAVIVDRRFEGDYSQEMNGTGPFMFDSFEREVLYTIVKNPDYWQPDLPYLDQIEFVPTEDDTARINSFLSEEVDFSEYIPWQHLEEVEQDDRFVLHLGFDLFNCVRLNVNREPLNDPLVRQALNFAVDREALISLAFGGYGNPMTVGLISPDSEWYNEQLDGHWSYDPDRALELLAEAGYDDPSEISLHIDTASLTIHQDTAEIVTQQLQDFGVSMTLEIIDVPELLDKRQSGDYTMLMDGLSVPWPDPDFYTQYFGTDGSSHAAGIDYSNPELDELLGEARATTDTEERKDLYRQIEELILEEAPLMFLFWRPQAEAHTARVQGYTRVAELGTGSVGFMERVWLEKDE